MHIQYNLLLSKPSQYEAKHKTKIDGANSFQHIKLVPAAKDLVSVSSSRKTTGTYTAEHKETHW